MSLANLETVSPQRDFLWSSSPPSSSFLILSDLFPFPALDVTLHWCIWHGFPKRRGAGQSTARAWKSGPGPARRQSGPARPIWQLRQLARFPPNLTSIRWANLKRQSTHGIWLQRETRLSSFSPSVLADERCAWFSRNLARNCYLPRGKFLPNFIRI